MLFHISDSDLVIQFAHTCTLSWHNKRSQKKICIRWGLYKQEFHLLQNIMVIIQYNLLFLFVLLMEFLLINGYSVFYLDRVCWDNWATLDMLIEI